MPDVLLIEESSGTRILGRREYTSAFFSIYTYMKNELYDTEHEILAVYNKSMHVIGSTESTDTYN